MHARPKSIFKDKNKNACASSLRDKCVVVPADKTSNNIVFVCTKYYYECLINILGISKNFGNHTYKNTSY